MSQIGGEAAGAQPKKKSPFSGCGILALVVIGLFIVLLVVSCNNTKEEAAEFTESVSTFAPNPVITGAMATKVKDACVQQVETVAKNAAREIAGVKPKFYTIKSTSFGGDIEEVALLHEEIAYEVPFTYVTKHDDGSEQTTTRTCRVSDDFAFVELRR
ncbi:hypothetical protein [Pseudarthrobacter chlorophenolicus]|uniref:hypothetical protein n=1 Tax=Pseudarthrobacter chlorophenolicus TaxID=85085 RepID=UPI0005F2FBB4|nr:hypothetical protein [Pseudarthrobacter chlorophenolicus]